MKKTNILLFLGLSLLSASLVAQVMTTDPIPRDTSFTLYQAWSKLRKEFPMAEMVKPVVPEEIQAVRNVVYATLENTPYGKRELHLDLFMPKGKGPFPALLMIHGGGWRSGSRQMEEPMALRIASAGYVTVTVEYRLSMEALYPAAVHDLKAALRYLRAHAGEYRIDPKRMATSGTSAGGQLAAFLAVTGNHAKFEGDEGNAGQTTAVQAVLDIDGILDFRDPNESGKDQDAARKSAGAYWFGGTFREIPEKWIEASPLDYVGPDSPPMLFVNSALPRFHAGRDSAIAILNRHGIYSEVHTLPDTPHPFWLFHPWFDPATGFMIAFLNKTLKKK